MNLSDFSLLKEDDGAYTIGHPKGKSMTIPKAGMSDKAHALISKLKKNQNFAEGTPEGTDNISAESQPDAEPNPVGSDSVQSAQSPQSPEASVDESISIDPNAAQAPPPGLALVQPGISAPQEASMGQGQAEAPQAPSGLYADAPIKTAEKDIQAGVEAEAKAGREKAQAYQDLGEASQQVQDSFEERRMKYDQDAQKFTDAVANGKIDPDRLFHNMGTGSRIATSLGLIISGLGSGLTHSPNLAAESLQRAIQEDIEAQKNDRSANQNLYRMNREALGDERQATLATQSQLVNIAKAKAMQAEASAIGPQAKARLAPVILGLEQQSQQLNWMRSRLSNGTSPGTEQDYNSNLQVMQRMNPAYYKDMEAKLIPGVGVARVPVTASDRQALKSYDVLENGVNKAINFAQNTGTTLPGSDKNAEAEAIRQDLVTGFQTLHDLKRLSDVDLKYNLSNISSPGAIMNGQAISQFKTLKDEIMNKKKVEYNQLGITPFQKAPQDMQAVEWAKKNPGPQADRILQINGVR